MILILGLTSTKRKRTLGWNKVIASGRDEMDCEKKCELSVLDFEGYATVDRKVHPMEIKIANVLHRRGAKWGQVMEIFNDNNQEKHLERVVTLERMMLKRVVAEAISQIAFCAIGEISDDPHGSELELAKVIRRKRYEICAEIEAQEVMRMFPRGTSAAVVKVVEDTFRKIGKSKQVNIKKESADCMHETGTLPTSARGAGNCFAGAEGVVSTAGHESGAEQGAEAARVPRTIREFIRAVFHFCRVL